MVMVGLAVGAASCVCGEDGHLYVVVLVKCIDYYWYLDRTCYLVRTWY